MIITETDLLNRQVARMSDHLKRGEQTWFFDQEASPDLKRERKEARKHRDAGGKELF